MLFFKKKYRKFNILGVILIILISILLLFAFDLSVFFAGYLSKILILVCTACIAIVEFGDVFKRKKQKKKALYSLVIALFLISLWDTGKESIDFESEARKRDSLITVDSLRFVKIVNDLSTSIGQLEEISGSVVKSLEEVVDVKNRVGEQSSVLKSISLNTSKSSWQTELLIDNNQPNLTIQNRPVQAYFDEKDFLNIKVFPVNTGNGIAYDIMVFYQVMFLENKSTPSAPNQYDVSTVYNAKNEGNLFPKQWTRLPTSQLLAHTGSQKNQMIITPSITKKAFKNKNCSWVLVYSISCFDFTKSKRISRTYTVIGKLKENNEFELEYNLLNLENIKSYFEQELNLGQFIFLP